MGKRPNQCSGCVQGRCQGVSCVCMGEVQPNHALWVPLNRKLATLSSLLLVRSHGHHKAWHNLTCNPCALRHHNALLAAWICGAPTGSGGCSEVALQPLVTRVLAGAGPETCHFWRAHTPSR